MALQPGSIAPDFDLPARGDGRDHVGLGTLTENGPALLLLQDQLPHLPVVVPSVG